MHFNLGYDDIGQNYEETIILIGGLGTQRTVWPDNFCEELLKNKYRVIRFDNRDIGESSFYKSISDSELSKLVSKSINGESFTPPYSLLDMANDTLALINKLELIKVHVVGMSMGGRIGHIIAKLENKNIKSLTSIMSTSGAPYLPSGIKVAIDSLMKKPKDEFNIDEIIDISLMQQKIIGSPSYPISEEYIKQIVKVNYLRGHNPKGIIRQWLASVSEGDQSNILSKIDIPALIIHGQNDPLIPYQCGIDIAEKIKNSKFVLIEGMGHNIPPLLSELLAEKLLVFYDEI